MAKKAWLERNKKRRALTAKYAEKRAELKLKGDYIALSKLPRNSSSVRIVNRCAISGRRHAYLRKFNCSRLVFREAALSGLIPGVTKASW